MDNFNKLLACILDPYISFVAIVLYIRDPFVSRFRSVKTCKDSFYVNCSFGRPSGSPLLFGFDVFFWSVALNSTSCALIEPLLLERKKTWPDLSHLHENYVLAVRVKMQQTVHVGSTHANQHRRII